MKFSVVPLHVLTIATCAACMSLAMILETSSVVSLSSVRLIGYRPDSPSDSWDLG